MLGNRPTRISMALLAVLMLSSTGCLRLKPVTAPPTTDNDTPSLQVERDLVTAAVLESPELVGDNVYEASSSVGVNSRPAGNGPAAAIEPLFFFRWFSNKSSIFEIDFGTNDASGRPTTASVTVTKNFRGRFTVTRAPNGDADTTNLAVNKNLADLGSRRVHLTRTKAAGDSISRWHVLSASGMRIQSTGGTRAVRTLRVQTLQSRLDMTYTDPTVPVELAQLPHFSTGDSIRVTVSSGSVSDIALVYWHNRRERMNSNGDGTHTLTFPAGFKNGLHDLAVNVLSRSTIYDDQSPYDSMSWTVLLDVR